MVDISGRAVCKGKLREEGCGCREEEGSRLGRKEHTCRHLRLDIWWEPKGWSVVSKHKIRTEGEGARAYQHPSHNMAGSEPGGLVVQLMPTEIQRCKADQSMAC